MRKSRKLIAILATLAMLATLLVPMVGPAAAKSLNSVDRVIGVSDTFSGKLGNTVTIKEDSDFKTDFKDGDTFRVSLPSPMKWLVGSGNTTVKVVYATTETPITPLKVSDQTLEIVLPGGSTSNAEVDSIIIEPAIDVNGGTGDITLTIDPRDSAVTGGTLVIGRVSGDKAAVVAESVETIGESGTGGIIRIDEAAVGALGTSENLTLKLPANFEWDGITSSHITLGGGFAGGVVGTPSVDGRTLTVSITLPASRTQRGTIYVTPKIKALSGAAYGDVTVTVSSEDISSTDVVVAKYAEWGVTVKVKEVKELLAGKFDDQTTEKITIEETVPNSLITGRKLRVELPDWVKIIGIDGWSVSGGNLNISAPTVDGKDSDFDVTISRNAGDVSTTGKIEFKLKLSIEGNKSGDIEASISSAGAANTKLVIAKAVVPVSAEAEVADVKIGVQNQSAPDLVITEAKKGAIEQKVEKNISGATRSGDGEITITLPAGVKFAATPKVEVTSGDLELKADQARLTDNDAVFRIPVKSESTKPSTIRVYGIKLTLDRTVPEGDLMVKVGGLAVVENTRANGDDANAIEAGEFDTGTAVKVKLANCITPAPGEQKSTVVFKVSDTKFTVNGVEQTMDVAPYIKNGRTYVPVRYSAQAVGVAADNILYSGGKVTLIKGDKVVQFTIGSNVMLINGVAINMDVKAEITNGRTMLPFRYVAQALGAQVNWDPTEQTVTMTL
ncbi:copper amine oxidase N-terminal domain-containing protein [Desulfofundulus salinus]|uniref:Copper amine oxidase N-terminal domain-containing protein n=1 Tax=Desulfofundulus salinus TaxID=2419843 RepID=A0A494WR47_9FIRM|nr:copper amine oxidase N-terminal domain-containing protein [Desulfofundulus salinum]RKO65649.1 copper amine oxidase N-terminal domain-containing protein [Desulfofundulus salinum]